jgi:excisionase family DNA binding protein
MSPKPSDGCQTVDMTLDDDFPRTPVGHHEDTSSQPVGDLLDKPALPTMPELLTITQAAAWLGMGRTTLYRALRSGQVPVKVFQIGSEKRLARRQIEEWLDTRLNEANQPQPTAEPERDIYAEIESLLTTSGAGRSAGTGRP